MANVDDARWREAASTLDLELFDVEGRKVTTADATRGHEMRGRVDDWFKCDTACTIRATGSP